MLTGSILGVITWISFLLMWQHMPIFIKKASIKHFIITDFVVAIFTWISITAITQSLAGAIATMVCGLLTNFSMMALDIKAVREYCGLVDVPKPRLKPRNKTKRVIRANQSARIRA